MLAYVVTLTWGFAERWTEAQQKLTFVVTRSLGGLSGEEIEVPKHFVLSIRRLLNPTPYQLVARFSYQSVD